MRVAVLYGYGTGGSGSAVYNQDMMRALCRDGHQVHLFFHEQSLRYRAASASDARIMFRKTGRYATHDPSTALYYHLLSNDCVPVCYPRPDLPHTHLLSEIDEKSIEAYVEKATSQLVREHARTPFDLVIAHHFSLLPEVARRFRGETQTPYALVSHGTGLLYGVSQNETLKGYASRYLSEADHVITLNESLATRICDAFPGVPWNPLVMPPGVDANAFRPKGSFAHTLLANSSPAPSRPYAPTLLYAGRIIADKGVHGLLASLPLVLDRIPDLRIRIAGGGAQADDFRESWRALCSGDAQGFVRICRAACEARAVSQAQLDELMLPLEGFLEWVDEAYFVLAARCENKIEWLSHVNRSRMVTLYQEADLSVLPSLVPEAHPLSVCESLSCETPVLGSDHSGIRTILDSLAPHAPHASARFRFQGDGGDWVRRFASSAADLLCQPPASDEMRGIRDFVSERYAWRGLLSALFPNHARMACDFEQREERVSVFPS